MTNYYRTSVQVMIRNWTWQDTFDVMIIIWMTDYCLMALYFTIVHVKEIIRLLKLRYELRKRGLEEERVRLRGLERECERAAQPKPWRPKPPKKKNLNYCGRNPNGW